MKFQSYLITEGRTRKISEKQFKDDVKKDCSQIIKTYKRLKRYYFRGIRHGNFSEPYGFVQPSKYTRQSAYADTNTYTLIIDNIDLFKNYPKRSKSIIMTTDENDARGRGQPYIIFPKNGANIGVCPKDDIWDSFPALFKRFYMNHMNGFNRFMVTLSHYIGRGLDMDEWSDIKKLLSMKPDEHFFERSPNDWMLNDKETLYDQIIPYMDPKMNGFARVGTKIVPQGNKECWTDADCYLFGDLSEIDELLEKL